MKFTCLKYFTSHDQFLLIRLLKSVHSHKNLMTIGENWHFQTWKKLVSDSNQKLKLSESSLDHLQQVDVKMYRNFLSYWFT